MSKFKIGDYVEVIQVDNDDINYGIRVGNRGYVLNEGNTLYVNFVDDCINLDKCITKENETGNYLYNKPMYDFQLKLVEEEYPLTIQDILAEANEGKHYIDNNGRKLKVLNGNLLDESNMYIARINALKNIVNLKFKEDVDYIDWSKITVDTPVLVKHHEYDKWLPRYFAKYKNREVYTWSSGRNSFTKLGDSDVVSWEFAKLYKEGE